MKKIVLLSLAVSAMIIIAISSASTTPSNPVNQIGPANKGDIRYQVVINNANDLQSLSCPILIVMTDISNRPVAPPQNFKPGVNVYNFYEFGPVTGVRVSHFVTDTRIQIPICKTVNAVDAMYGTFMPGNSYTFYITPFNNGKPGGD
jgi:hypothetical protein